MWYVARAPRLRPRIGRPRGGLTVGFFLLAAAAVATSCLTSRFGRGPICASVASETKFLHKTPGPIDFSPALAGALAKAQEDIGRLSIRVAKKGIVPGFGQKAVAIIRRAVEAVGSSGAEAQQLEEALDAPLEALFVQQVQMLVAEAIDLYDAQMESKPNPLEAGLAAQALFDNVILDLRRPGSTWSSNAESKDLLAHIGENYGRDTTFLAEQARQGQGKQVTIEVIRKLQQQAVQVQRDIGNRGAFPWNVKWQYMIENSPLGFRGQYEKGRSVLELLLMPSPDPRKKDNLLNKIGPLNLAVAFDMLK